VKRYARHAQLGENFELNRVTLKFDGVFRSFQGFGSLLGMLCLLCSSFSHIWHHVRIFFRDVFAGIDPDLDAQMEFGAF